RARRSQPRRRRSNGSPRAERRETEASQPGTAVEETRRRLSFRRATAVRDPRRRESTSAGVVVSAPRLAALAALTTALVAPTAVETASRRRLSFRRRAPRPRRPTAEETRWRLSFRLDRDLSLMPGTEEVRLYVRSVVTLYGIGVQ
ncbi:MAG TPA: hypothetical protein VMZ53_04290, partial [Kofleriaceae bacterium]|nr:hypothetical protein [Kofleriaceae bacterium]